MAEADAYEIEEDQSLTVPAPGVLSNDSDADGDQLTASLGNNPTNGTLTLSADGSFTYTPDADSTVPIASPTGPAMELPTPPRQQSRSRWWR